MLVVRHKRLVLVVGLVLDERSFESDIVVWIIWSADIKAGMKPTFDVSDCSELSTQQLSAMAIMAKIYRR